MSRRATPSPSCGAARRNSTAGLGGASWQVARDYPFREVLAPQTWHLLEAVKSALDPKGLINPGSLGLAP